MNSFIAKLNGPWHAWALRTFTLVVLAHWAEHLVQAYQVYGLGWPLHQARGVLGQAFPWLVHSEALHYGYAVIMLAGIWMLLPGFVGRARTWWLAALVIQFWHHVEHALLQGQVIAGRTLFGAAGPTSILQLWFPRLELHLFYNTVVFIPMVVAMYCHLFSGCARSCADAMQLRAAFAPRDDLTSRRAHHVSFAVQISLSYSDTVR